MFLKTQMFIHNAMTKLMNPLANNEGATVVEYGIMVALIAAVIVTIVGVLGGQVNDAFTTVSDALP